MPSLDFNGRVSFKLEHREGPGTLFAAVPCFVESLPQQYLALLDTAAQWSIMPPAVARALGLETRLETLESSDPTILSMSSRFGLIRGRIFRFSIRFPAEEGDSLELDAPCFTSDDWPGPMIIGWKGCLEWLKFAVDAPEATFYFGS